MKRFKVPLVDFSLRRAFNDEAESPRVETPVAPAKPAKPKRASPISLRLNEEERALLERDAAGMSVSAYIRERLFGDAASPRKTRGKFPVKDQKALAQVLSALGRSGIARDLEALRANSAAGGLDAAQARALERACDDVAAMRRDLVAALGLKPES